MSTHLKANDLGSFVTGAQKFFRAEIFKLYILKKSNTKKFF